ncbi:hypothetical protein AJ80_01919 [Polytolypa hystricis UAMH7299]|uniref:Peptidase A1 domain-containing protein n=1 Tax=Polytolypa hystricis (strain UAMH7299) TaxID=1447883 RepID=A0A2B7YZE8_POLH7|nr:hypothetical protein AJ80_01919 [Polytolypa hystricis UAMH7299]
MRTLAPIAQLLCLLAIATVSVEAARNFSASPVVVPPSQIWEGNDGSWSTFFLRLGNKLDPIRTLVSTSGTYVVAVLAQACDSAEDKNACAEGRGLTFDPSHSSTWYDQGFFALDQQNNLGLSVPGNFGLDRVGLGIVDNPDLEFPNQTIGGIIAEEFYFGSLGLSIQPTNFSTFTDPKSSFITSLRDDGAIPSLSWAYTAGAEYRLTKVPGSLVFGGYDSSRFTPNDLTIHMSPDSSRDLIVGLQSITTRDADGKETTLMSSGIFSFVDSTLPYIWLPREACDAFEKEFGLTWNATLEMYLVNETAYKTLTERKPHFNFTIGPEKEGGETVRFDLPYDSFDLTAKPPLTSDNTRYFPIKRAANDTQYTLGRAFLQEVYLIADYERSNFSLSQCTFTAGAKPTIVPIKSVDAKIITISGPDPTSRSLSAGAIAGIVVGVVLGLLAIAGLAFFWTSRIQRRQAATDPSHPGYSEMEDSNRPAAAEVSGDHPQPKTELEGSLLAKFSNKPPAEMDSGNNNQPADGFYSPKAEDAPQELAPEAAIHEMFDPSVYREMADTAGTSTQATRAAASRAVESRAAAATGRLDTIEELQSPVSSVDPLTPLPSYSEGVSTTMSMGSIQPTLFTTRPLAPTSEDMDKKLPLDEQSSEGPVSQQTSTQGDAGAVAESNAQESPPAAQAGTEALTSPSDGQSPPEEPPPPPSSEPGAKQ